MFDFTAVLFLLGLSCVLQHSILSWHEESIYFFPKDSSVPIKYDGFCTGPLLQRELNVTIHSEICSIHTVCIRLPYAKGCMTCLSWSAVKERKSTGNDGTGSEKSENLFSLIFIDYMLWLLTLFGHPNISFLYKEMHIQGSGPAAFFWMIVSKNSVTLKGNLKYVWKPMTVVTGENYKISIQQGSLH